jgi:hypothetical protein
MRLSNLQNDFGFEGGIARDGVALIVEQLGDIE